MSFRSRRPRPTASIRGTAHLAAWFLAALASNTATARAQQAALRAGQRPGPRFVVPTLRSDTATLGFEVAGALRERLANDFDIRALMVVPESAITKALEDFGYSPTQSLKPSEARQLASQFQADEYLDGAVRRTADGGYRVEVDWALARRDEMVQPLPPVEGRKISDVAKLLSHEVQLARKQLESVRRCMEFSRTRDFANALVEARKAIATYPQSALARVCIANVYAAQNAPPDSIIKVTEEVLSIHRENRRALALAADAYHAKGMRAQEIEKLLALFDLDSTNARAVAAAVRLLGEAKAFDRAKEVAARGVRANPGNAELLGMQWRVAMALGEWHDATRIGGELLAADSTVADEDFFRRMASAFVEDSQPKEGADFLARGVARFPANDDLAVLRVQLLRRAGELDSALQATDRLIARNPAAANIWIQRARTQAELKLTADSVLGSLARGLEHGEDKTTVSGFAATLGQAASRAASASKALDDYRMAVRYFRFAEGIVSRDTTAFLLGAAHLSLGQQLYAHAREARSCDEAKEMLVQLVDAQLNITKGGRAFPELAAQLLSRIQEVTPFASQLEKSVCR